MTQIKISAGDTLSAIAQKYLGDPSKWREIAEVTGINPLENLQVGTTITLPDYSRVIDKATPVLNDVSAGLNQASLVLDTLDGVPVLGGYAKIALTQIDNVNGAVGQATQVLADVAGTVDKARNYNGSIKLIDWLLQ